MPVGAVTKYNQLEKRLFDTDSRQWNDSAPGSIMFCLVSNGYTPSATHSTTADLGANLLTTGDGAARIAATGLTVDSTTTPGTTYYGSNDITWGSSVTITAKYLVCVQPVTANTFNAATSRLLFYVDLNDTSGTTTVTATAEPFSVLAPTNGWFETE